MPLSTSQYGFIIDPMVPFTDASGTTIRNGYVRVFVAGSSTPVITYKNYDGATNEETIQLDNSGRTAYPVIVSKGNTYKVCVYDAEHSQESPILTIDKVVPAGANVEATNIVTGLDNVESPEAGWVKSTVSGTDAEVSLDATNVTSEVDTMVKATAASADYMMPLVHKTGSDPDKKITLGNLFKFVLNFIHSLTDTATESDLVSGNYLALDGSAGTKKLPGDAVAPKSVQDNLVGSIAPEYVGATGAIAGKIYMHSGALYRCKENTSGAWDGTKFQSTNIDEILNFDVDGENLVERFSISNGDRLNKRIKFSKNNVALIVYSGANYSQTYRVYFADSTGTKPDRTGDTTNYPTGVLNIVTIPDGYDTIWLFNASYNTSGVAAEVSVYDKSEDSLQEVRDMVEENIYGCTNIENFLIKNNDRLNKRKVYSSSHVKFSMSYSGTYPDEFHVYFSDSTGTNPDDSTSNTRLYKKGNFYEIDIPAGYDSLWFFCGTYNTTGSDIPAWVGETVEGTLNYKLTGLEGNLVNNYLKGKKVVCFGDSITAFDFNGMTYSKYLQEYTGANVINAGLGGTRYAPRRTSSPTVNGETQAYANLDIYYRVHAWCENEWTDVDAAVTYLQGQGVNVQSYIDALKNNPIATADVVTLFAGTNDFSGGVELGSVDSMDTSKTLGALNKIIEELLTTNGKLKIFVFTPTIRYMQNNRTDPYYSDNYKNSQDITLKDEAQAILECAKNNHVPVCDLYNSLGWNKFNFSTYFIDSDGTHPYKGFDSIARRFAGFIISNAW